ncbi:hypothetical protein D3C81_1737140 [compost metagenome]
MKPSAPSSSKRLSSLSTSRSRLRTVEPLTTLPLARPSTKPEAICQSGPRGASWQRDSRRAKTRAM